MADPLHALERLLEKERKALVAGGLHEIEACAAEKAELLGRLAELPPGEGARLDALAPQLERNRTLLAAALEGVRSATARLEAVRAARSRLTTYDAQGRASDLAPSGAALMRKA